MSNSIEVKVPDIGDFSDVEVIEVLVASGDAISAEQSLITVESDKASMEIPSPAAGVVQAVKVKVGDKVSEGSVILMLASEDATSSPAPAGEPAPGPADEAAPRAAPVPPPAAAPSSAAAATPAATAPKAAGTDQAGGGQTQVVSVPDIGDFADVEVIEILVAPGDTVAAEQSLITVESDKASMEIPSPVAGVVRALRVNVGDKVSKGSAILELSSDAQAPQAPEPAAAPPAGAPSSEPSGSAPPPRTQTSDAAGASAGRDRAAPVPHRPGDVDRVVKPHASPSVRAFARELGVDLQRVDGSGPKQRILRDDVVAYVKRSLAGGATAARAPAAAAADGAGLGLIPWPKVDFAKFGPIDSKPLSRIKKISAANLHRNWVMIPHVTNHDDADVTELEAFRKQLNKENERAGIKVTMLAFLVKACVAALKKFPEFNASLDGESLVLKRYFHIGVAADTPNGLVVPVIRDADQKGVLAIAKEMAELAAKARDGKLTPSEMQGGTFSISSLGGIGGTYFTPIINAPEVAILGVCRSEMRPVWNGQSFEPRLILPMSLSWDHRVIDGAAAARFNAYLGQVLADFRRVML
ncbi:MAG: dihydrolipoyllysine-residue acetyltransferase [Burkholderiaceae bacterium]